MNTHEIARNIVENVPRNELGGILFDPFYKSVVLQLDIFTARVSACRRSDAFREVMDYLRAFDCNCGSIERKGGHLLTCPKAVVGWIDCKVAEEESR